MNPRSGSPGGVASPQQRTKDLRLTPRKIEYLAGKLLKMMQDNRLIHLQAPPDLVQRTVEDILYTNMQTEDDIEAEVDDLLSRHRGEIDAMEMDMGVLRAKMKREIARKRGFVL